MRYPVVFCGSNLGVLEYLAKRQDIRITHCFFHKKSGDFRRFLSLCKAYGLKHAVIKNNSEMESILGKIPRAVLGISSGFVMLSENIFCWPKSGFINIHPSYLPYYKGANPFYYMLINNEKKGGVSIHRITKGVDCGKILARAKYPIDYSDDIEVLIKKAEALSVKLLDKYLIKILKGTAREIANPPGNYYPLIKQRQYINLKAEPLRIYNLVRSQTIYGGCFLNYKGKRLVVIKAEIVSATARDDKLSPQQLRLKINRAVDVIFTLGEARRGICESCLRSGKKR